MSCGSGARLLDGEEVYSLAILLREHMLTLANPPRVQIFATDIDERALTVARTGRYPRAYLDAVSPERIAQHFAVEGISAVVEKAVRDCARSPPQRAARSAVLATRSRLLPQPVDLSRRRSSATFDAGATLRPAPRGYLFIGMAENVTRFEDLFETIDKRHRIFQARDVILPARLPPMSGPDTLTFASASQPYRRNEKTHAALRHAVETQMLSSLRRPTRS